MPQNNIVLFIVSCLLLSCGSDDNTTHTIVTEDTVAVAENIRFDTAGCVMQPSDTALYFYADTRDMNFFSETYCSDRTFTDTTWTSNGTEDFTNVGLYNYTETKLTLQQGENSREVILTNATFRDSIGESFYRRGMLDAPYEIWYDITDTSFTAKNNLYVPGDDHIIVSFRVNMKGEVTVTSTEYEGAY